MRVGKPMNRQDGDDLARVMNERNALCSGRLLDALQKHHGVVQDNPEPKPVAKAEFEPLPPIPNKVIAKAADIAFPRFNFATAGRIAAIKRATLTEYPGISLNDLTSSRRTAKMVFARQVAMYLAKKLTPNSLPEIGRRFGGRDHTTVLHAVRKIEDLVSRDQALAAQVERIASLCPEPA